MAADPIISIPTRSLPRTGSGSQMPLAGPFIRATLTAQRDVHVLLREAQDVLWATGERLGGTLVTARTTFTA